ncbi:MAG: hypothetical protein FWG65_10015 [Turicibacter sp.]|nr:hypothetical protein [Turicibacter sp.]
MEKKDEKVYWHEAFSAGYEAEFDEERQNLTFINEHPLGKEALIMDVLLIKKNPAVKIHKNIGRIFRTHNIAEYKSPTDTLNVRDYQKVMGYAFLYASFSEVELSEITITFVITSYPRDLIKYLKNERHLQIKELENGIYFAEGDVFPLQIIESKSLSAETNIFLKNLRSGLSKEDVLSTFAEGRKKGILNARNPYFDRLIRANPAAFKEAIRMDETLEKILLEAFEESGLLAKAIRMDKTLEKNLFEAFEESGLLAKRDTERNMTTARKMLSLGDAIESIAERLDLPVEMIENLRNA